MGKVEQILKEQIEKWVEQNDVKPSFVVMNYYFYERLLDELQEKIIKGVDDLRYRVIYEYEGIKIIRTFDTHDNHLILG